MMQAYFYAQIVSFRKLSGELP